MDYKQEADKIVEMFLNEIDSQVGVDGCRDGYCYASVGYKKDAAIKCAIKHVEGMIYYNARPDEEYWNEIINQLKQM